MTVRRSTEPAAEPWTVSATTRARSSRAAVARRARPDTAATAHELTDFASRVLDVAESIPPGRVMSYGDIAAVLGTGGPRQVGRVMALWGGGVPWWRVVHADGSLLPGHEAEALAGYRLEQTPLRGRDSGAPGRIDMRRARWYPGEADVATA